MADFRRAAHLARRLQQDRQRPQGAGTIRVQGGLTMFDKLQNAATAAVAALVFATVSVTAAVGPAANPGSEQVALATAPASDEARA